MSPPLDPGSSLPLDSYGSKGNASGLVTYMTSRPDRYGSNSLPFTFCLRRKSGHRGRGQLEAGLNNKCLVEKRGREEA